MSTLRFHQTTTSTPEQFLAALIDFGPGRSKVFGNRDRRRLGLSFTNGTPRAWPGVQCVVVGLDLEGRQTALWEGQSPGELKPEDLRLHALPMPVLPHESINVVRVYLIPPPKPGAEAAPRPDGP